MERHLPAEAAERNRQCAVLFGIPVNREEFNCRAEQSAGASSDYMTGLLRGRSPEVVWEKDYSAVAEAAQSVIHTANRWRVSIYQRSTLSSVYSATRHHRTVILIAHWRGAMFRVDDLMADFTSIRVRMEGDSKLRNIKLNSCDGLGLVDALNAAVYGLDLLPEIPSVPSQIQSRVLSQTLCRDLIDERLEGLVRPGNRLELWDGLYTPGEFEESIWDQFSGTLDLALCNSAGLATMIDLRRKSRIRKLFWEDLLNPIPQLLKVELSLRLSHSADSDYADTRLELERNEKRMLREDR
jgi:hypothetical protein